MSRNSQIHRADRTKSMDLALEKKGFIKDGLLSIPIVRISADRQKKGREIEEDNEKFIRTTVAFFYHKNNSSLTLNV